MNIGGAIYAQRLKRGLTQRALAARALMTPANLSAIETGRRDLTVQTLLRIARVLQTPAATFLDEPTGLRNALPHDTFNQVAGAVLSGCRPFSVELNQLADAVAWNARPILAAVGAPGQ